MKKILLLITFLVSINLFGQELVYETDFTKYIDSLDSEITRNKVLIEQLIEKNKFLEIEIQAAHRKNDSLSFDENKTKVVYSSGNVIFYTDTDMKNKNLELPRNVKVGVLEDLGNRYKILYNSEVGYAYKYGFISEEAYLESEQSRKEKLKAEEEAIIKRRKEIEEENNRREQARLKREQEERDRLPNMIKKYGAEKGKIIAECKVRIGFTSEMCIDAWGKPSSINRTTSSYSVREQWVYGNRSYLYFNNGILETIQN